MNRIKEAIKADIIGFLFVGFLLGAGFIWLGTAYGILRISDEGKINATVLWLTALAIFWYAYETYQLKKSTSIQVDIQEEGLLNEFLPILEPVSKRSKASVTRRGLEHVYIRNVGKGPAKYVEVRVNKVRISIEASLGRNEEVAVRPRTTQQREIGRLVARAPGHLSLQIFYEDIYGRKFKTDNCVLEPHSPGTYQLRQGAWDFKRTRTVKSLQR